MSISQMMNDRANEKNIDFPKTINRMYQDLIVSIARRAQAGNTSLRYIVEGPFDVSGCLEASIQIRSRLTRDGFVVRDAYHRNGNVVETLFIINW